MAKLKLDFPLHLAAVVSIMLWSYLGTIFIPPLYFAAITAIFAMVGKGLFDVYCAHSKMDIVDYTGNVVGFVIGLLALFACEIWFVPLFK